MPPLRAEQIESYKKDGYLSGIDVLAGTDVQRIQGCFDKLESETGRARCQTGLFDYHFKQPFIWEMATHTKIVDRVTEIIGDDILLLSTHFFCKYGPDDKFVAWHQDLRYWGIEPPVEVTAWYAVDDSNRKNGCMQIIPSTHVGGLMDHGKSEEPGNLLSINQELTVTKQQETQAIDCILKAGQMSLHDGMAIHGSLPNRSNHRRCGMTIRYIPASVTPTAPGPIGTKNKWRPILVHGKDQHGNFELAKPPFSFPHRKDIT